MEQTAVEWLIEEIENYLLVNSEYTREEIFNQAKEMFEQQIINARENGFFSSENWKGDSKRYYKETFNK